LNRSRGRTERKKVRVSDLQWLPTSSAARQHAGGTRRWGKEVARRSRLHAPSVIRDSKHMCSSPSESGSVVVDSAPRGTMQAVATTKRTPRRSRSTDLMVLILIC
jgi:hypothetical protein